MDFSLTKAGFHHNWHRTYDPTTGRYLQQDPLGMPDGPARWAYARSAPTMYVDPTGEFVPLALLAGAWAAAEIGLSLYDVYNLANVWLDPCATDLERQLTTAATAAGIFLPGAGYSAAGRGLSSDPVVRAMQIAAEQAAGVSLPSQLTGYTRHGLNQAISRDGVGISGEAILNTLRRPSRIEHVPTRQGPTFRLTGEDAVVVVNPQGRVITTWPRGATGTRSQ